MPTKPDKSTKLNLPEGVPPLTTFYMYITGGCNLACKHCWISPTFEQNGSTGECLDFDLYKLAIEQALPLGLNGIKYTGGEPLLHPDFVKMVDFATKKKLKTWLETNGTLMTKELAHHLKEKTSMHHISVSIDGATPSTHDHFRNVKGSFNSALIGIKHLAAAGYKPQIIMSLFPENIDEIEPLVKITKESGCGSIKFNIIQSSGRGEKMKKKDGEITIEQLINIGKWIETELQSKYEIPLMFSWPMAFQSIKRLGSGLIGNCHIFNVLGILSTGKMAMCGIGTQEKDLIYGNLGINKISEIWTENPGLKSLRKNIPDKLEGICHKCLFKNSCIGACVAHNYHAEKKLTAPFWFCEQALKNKLFPVTRML